MLQRQFRVHVLEPAVLFFQFTQAANVRGLHVPVLCLPLVIGGVADFVFATNISDGLARLNGFQNGDDLRLAKFALSHRPPGVILARKPLLFNGPIFGEGYKLNVDLVPPLDRPPSVDSREAAKQAFQEIVEESQLNGDLFQKLLLFLYQAIFSLVSFEDEVSPDKERAATDLMRSILFEVFTEPAIKITNRLILTFQTLIAENHAEEVYQRFLTKNPVFIDPLASEVIPKQKLGLEHVTDFVIRRLDDEYILVEIEKPQDTIFTGANDLTARFTHAYGQVLGFQEWVDAHGEYARSLMPGIFSPKGVLIVGMRNELSAEQVAKLKRLNINSRSIEVLTYDDLIRKAKDLYQNIHRKRT